MDKNGDLSEYLSDKTIEDQPTSQSDHNELVRDKVDPESNEENLLDDENASDELDTTEHELSATAEKKYKYGIIYLSYIPEGLNVKLLREIMSEFGEVGRIFLERDEKKKRCYLEGWIEFKKKRVAKSVAKTLNGTPLQYGRKHCKMNGQIWNIKYLHKFKWVHLTEQLIHDKAVRDQRRIFEMSQTKKQVDFYQKMTERAKRLKKVRKGEDGGKISSKIPNDLSSKQKKPRSHGEELAVSVDEDLLSRIFK